MDHVVNVYKNFSDFSGRSSRAQYWTFFLFSFIVGLLLSVIDGFITVTLEIPSPFYLIFALITFVPAIALSIRRLHDVNKSGLWLLLAFVPLGFLVLIYFYIQPGTEGENEYGAAPLKA